MVEGTHRTTQRGADLPAVTTGKDRVAFVDIGRAIAALLVVYTHIPGRNPAETGPGEHTAYLAVIEAFTSEPLHMLKQGIGQVAVPFLFLVSGFVVTPSAIKQGQARFAINRLLRIYAPMIFVVTVTALALIANLHPPSTGQAQDLSPLTILTNITTANYLIYPQVVLVPVAWTMIIEVLFYLMLLALVPLLRRSVWLTIAVELTFVFVVLMSRSELNESYSLFAANVSFLPILIIGQIIWATTTRRIPLWAGGIFGATAWSLYVLAGIVGIHRIDNSYNLAVAIAVLCFLVGLFAEERLKQRRFWVALSERTYSIYLLHGLCLYVVLHALSDVPFTIGLIAALAATALLVEISYRLVEAPSHKLARHLSRRRRRPRAQPVQAETRHREPSETATPTQTSANEVTQELEAIGHSGRGPHRELHDG